MNLIFDCRNISLQSTIETSEEHLCPLKDCNFEFTRMNELREHWDKAHSYLRFPEFRDESKFSYTTSANEDDVSTVEFSILNFFWK